MLRAALLLLSGNTATAGLLFARNIAVAAAIPLADYGIAATFALALGVVQMSSALGLQQQIIQAKEGDDPRFQAALQGFQLLRGVATGLLLLLLAGPIAAFLQIEEATWALRLLALVPVLNAMQHFDIHRKNRAMQYGPMLLTQTLPAAIGLLAVWPLALLFGDWQVMLWSILLQAAAGAAVSHLVAERPWQVMLDRAVMLRGLRFGWPILANAILLFLVMQGEKLIVGRLFGMEALGLFAMGVTLTLTPTLILARSAQNLSLPRLSAAPEGAGFTRIATAVNLGILLVGGLTAVGGLILLPPLVHLLLGEKYAPLIPYLGWMAVQQGLRVLKGGPATVALSRAKNEQSFLANLVRVALLPLAFVVAERTGSLPAVIALGILGEGLGALVAFLLLRLRLGLPLRPLLLPGGLMLAAMAAVILAGWALIAPEAAPLPWGWGAGAAGLLLAGALVAMGPLWALLGRMRRR